MKKQNFEIINTGSYKIGMNEIKGLETAIREVLTPVRDALKDKIYWDDLEMEQVEYKSRDGFIAHSHNCGGIEFSAILPSCESYNFNFVEFGECDECGNEETYPEGDHQCGYEGQECGYESEGHLDAFFRVRLKFEGISDEGSLKFYLFAEGGNNDAPYFRSVPTVFESEFECKSIAGLKKAAAKSIKGLLKLIG